VSSPDLRLSNRKQSLSSSKGAVMVPKGTALVPLESGILAIDGVEGLFLSSNNYYTSKPKGGTHIL
jgi:hypothetical protein